jgi:hypothetical protein
MATPADERLLELLERWLCSLDLHRQYTALDAVSYAAVQSWPPHQRPNAWIIDLARQKVLALLAEVRGRIAAGDGGFSDALEAMAFLANLVGAEHIERSIPLAVPARERDPAANTAPTLERVLSATTPALASADGTREMPQFLAEAHTLGEVLTLVEADTLAEVHTLVEADTEAPEPGIATTQMTAPEPTSPEGAREQVIADAERLMQWGRKWYELAELIARMADRPPLPEVRRLLKDNKMLIDDRIRRLKE